MFTENNRLLDYPDKSRILRLCRTLLDEPESHLRSSYSPAAKDHNSTHAKGLLPLFPARLLDGDVNSLNDLQTLSTRPGPRGPSRPPIRWLAPMIYIMASPI